MCVAPFDRNLLSRGQGTREKRIGLHYDNALVHNTEKVQQILAYFEFRRIEHPR
jgi:hypothetical protein